MRLGMSFANSSTEPQPAWEETVVPNTADARVAVVMITHNRCAEVLRSLGHLTHLPERPRIVLVDNGSSDNTAGAVAERLPEVLVVESGCNLGAAGRNLGVLNTAAHYIAFCDDDTWWHPGGLRRAADLMDTCPRLAVLTGRVLIGPERQEDPACRVMSASPLKPEPGMPGPPLLGFLAGASVVRRSAFLEAGGFPTRVLIGGEEQCLAVDLAARGWWLCYLRELVVYHYPSARRDAPARRANEIRSALWFAWLRRPWLSALRQTLRLARSSVRSLPARRAFLSALGGLPGVLRERHVVPLCVEQGLRRLEVTEMGGRR
jgi:GT2 family glycosyltransferase